jgi:hypothetical protein
MASETGFWTALECAIGAAFRRALGGTAGTIGTALGAAPGTASWVASESKPGTAPAETVESVLVGFKSVFETVLRTPWPNALDGFSAVCNRGGTSANMDAACGESFSFSV